MRPSCHDRGRGRDTPCAQPRPLSLSAECRGVPTHRIGAAAAVLAGVSSYETTVDRDHLNRVDRHVVSRAAGTGYDGVGR